MTQHLFNTADFPVIENTDEFSVALIQMYQQEMAGIPDGMAVGFRILLELTEKLDENEARFDTETAAEITDELEQWQRDDQLE